MAKGICPVEGCTRPIEVREYCRPCYRRLKTHGLIANLPAIPPIRERFMDMVKKMPSGCWEWQAAKNDLGYGQLTLPGKKRVYAHRFSYEKHVGPIPEGMDLDHLCRNPSCVNPDHLEPVTHRENMHRGASPSITVFLSGRCARGHEMTGDNVYWSPTVPGKRECRKCMRIRELKREPRPYVPRTSGRRSA